MKESLRSEIESTTLTGPRQECDYRRLLTVSGPSLMIRSSKFLANLVEGSSSVSPAPRIIHEIQEYFHKNNTYVELPHLRIAVKSLYDNAIYLYGIIKLRRRKLEIRKTLLDTFGWKINKTHAENCWNASKIQSSL